MNVDDYVKQIAEAKVFEFGNRITDGRYQWAVKKILIEKKHKGIMFIAELLCLSSAPVTVSHDLVEVGEDVAKLKPIGVNESASFVVNLSEGESAFGNAKAFLLALDGSDPKTVEPAALTNMINAAKSDAQPFRGALINDETFRKKIKTPKSANRTVFMGHNWRHVVQGLPEIAQRRAQIDALDRAAAAKPAA